MVARERRSGNVNGILLLDKPKGLTSNQALQQAKRLVQARKAGHTGSLDPIATGLLPLCFGEATKISGFLLDSDKRYLTTFRLGQTTATGDAEGEVVRSRPVEATRMQIEQALDAFRGEIDQVPPMHSALKRDGQPLYKLAREGVEVELAPRRVTVHALVLVDMPQPDLVELDLRCSRGFYVRSLATDLGERLGCGAHVVALRRTEVGPFGLDEAITLDALEAMGNPAARQGVLLPADVALRHLPAVELSQDAAYYLCRGQAVRVGSAPSGVWVRLYSEPAGFLGVGQVLDDGRIAPKRLFHTA